MQLITTKLHTCYLKCSVGNLCKGLHVDTSLMDHLWDNSSPKARVRVAALAQNAGQHNICELQTMSTAHTVPPSSAVSIEIACASLRTRYQALIGSLRVS